jgi:hypothetical protein
MLTKLPTGDVFATNIPEPGKISKSKKRALLIELLDGFNSQPWNLAWLKEIQILAYKMMKKYPKVSAKYAYLEDLLTKAKTREREINTRIDRFLQTSRVSTTGRGLRGIYALEGQKHKGPRVRVSDWERSMLNNGGRQFYEQMGNRFQDPQLVFEAIGSGKFDGLSRQDLYALKKSYKDMELNRQLFPDPLGRPKINTSNEVPYLNDGQRAVVQVGYEGARVQQDGTDFDTTSFIGEWGNNEVALYALSLEGDLYAMSMGGPGSFEQYLKRLGLTKQHGVNHSTFLAGDAVVCAGMLRALKGELTDIDNESGHYKPSGRDLAFAITMLGCTGDIAYLRAAAKISNEYYYYFPATELLSQPGQQLKSQWADVGDKIILDAPELRQIRFERKNGLPTPFAELRAAFRDATAQRETEIIDKFPFDNA